MTDLATRCTPLRPYIMLVLTPTFPRCQHKLIQVKLSTQPCILRAIIVSGPR